ncbi:hypothetical protein DIT71_15535 [Marinobacter vulgaris]|uniref:O-antigen ligase-related domain-containing protein n=1 Tax=Marinobacter vulgaris TaxID=1928331 RepID=A0A2V3ZH04_9GAMM|nr:O-antigen ligase family protein [Marinobacter vulgaris]PXX89312.1 hypothetical protein DIT71_15535 [Marinobacter vulgaris]TSJ68125.1 O-antigen ligase family protein [Marinobacter vulgaris]
MFNPKNQRLQALAHYPKSTLSAIGVGACMVYALFELSLPYIGRLAETVLILLTLLALAKGERNKLLFIPLLGLGAAIAVSTTSWVASFSATSYGFQPETAPRIDEIAKWFLFIVPAFWLSGKRHAPALFCASAVIGLIALPWISGDGLSEFTQALENRRIDAGAMNAQHAAMLAGLTLILACCLILPGNTAVSSSALPLMAGTILAILSLLLLYATQTRGVWLGCTIAAIVMLITSILGKRNATVRKDRGLITAALVALILSGILWTATSSSVVDRFTRETGTISLALAGEFDNLPADSAGVRLRSWHHALPWIREKFWFGWGPDGSEVIMQESGALPAALRDHFGHLHNTYLDIMARYGFVGLLLYLLLLAWFARLIVRSYREDALSPGAYLFGIGFLAYWLTVNFFESYMLFSSGKYAFTVVVACLISLANVRSESTNGALQ